ncbi:MAG: LptF/LptG family permease, partial [Caulobacteraceae bacterium]|nr:LptF/LptG family permease [Caulobacteraceae bacterium]
MTAGSRRLERYILVRTLAGLGVALAMIATVILLIDLVDLSHTWSGGRDPGFPQLLLLAGLKSPAIVLVLAPFVVLFGVMGAFVGLNRRGELIAMRAAGLSAWRFVAPAAGAAVVLGFVTVGALNPAASALNGAFEDRRQAVSRDRGSAAREIWLRQGDDLQQVVIHALSHDTVDDRVRLTQVSLFIQRLGADGSLTFSRRLEAGRALLMPGYWRLYDVREAAPGSGSVRAEQLSLPSMLDHRTAMEKFASPAAVPFWDLPS